VRQWLHAYLPAPDQLTGGVKIVSVDANGGAPVPVEDRKPDGTFAPGHKGSGGNPANARAQHFRALILASETDEQFQAVWASIRECATKGNAAAQQLYMERICGKVPQALEHSGPEGGGIVIQYLLAKKPADG
jgi:hypothetical protein